MEYKLNPDKTMYIIKTITHSINNTVMNFIVAVLVEINPQESKNANSETIIIPKNIKYSIYL
jgi:hypothetical protein